MRYSASSGRSSLQLANHLMLFVLRRLVSPAVVCVLVSLPGIASAQMLGGLRPQTTAPRAQGFLTGFRTMFGVQHMHSAGVEAAFDWDLDLSIDFDVIDLGFARVNVFGDFETIIGSELRAIDPNQSNYAVDLSIFFRLPRGELAGTIHHVSRHLVDRARRDSVAWNMLGIAYGDRFSIGQLEVDTGVARHGHGPGAQRGLPWAVRGVREHGALDHPDSCDHCRC